jgi:hypothetical protein
MTIKIPQLHDKYLQRSAGNISSHGIVIVPSASYLFCLSDSSKSKQWNAIVNHSDILGDQSNYSEATSCSCAKVNCSINDIRIDLDIVILRFH